LTDDTASEFVDVAAPTQPEEHLAALSAAIDAVVSDVEGWAADARAKLQALHDAFSSPTP
jgi:hypothetical protein